MACYYTGSAAGDAELAHQETNKVLTMLTAMLCGLCMEEASKAKAEQFKTGEWEDTKTLAQQIIVY